MNKDRQVTISFDSHLLPVTLVNLIGGAAFVGIVYWAIHLRKQVYRC